MWFKLKTEFPPLLKVTGITDKLDGKDIHRGLQVNQTGNIQLVFLINLITLTRRKEKYIPLRKEMVTDAILQKTYVAECADPFAH